MTFVREIEHKAVCDGCEIGDVFLQYENQKDLTVEIKLNRWTVIGKQHFCWACSLKKKLEALPRKKWNIVIGTTESGIRREVMIDEDVQSIYWHLGSFYSIWQSRETLKGRDNHSKYGDYWYLDFKVETSDIHPWDKERQ
jgi:hypothetical protein